MRKRIIAAGLIAVIVLSAAWAGITIDGQRPRRPVAGSFHRSKVDAAGHTRGIVQVDLMRRIMADRARSAPPAPGRAIPPDSVPSQAHPLLGRPAPPSCCRTPTARPATCATRSPDGPVVVVFYLGSTCMACVTHLVELDAALPRFRERGAACGPSAPTRPSSRAARRRFGELAIPSLERPGPRGRDRLRRLEADPRRRDRTMARPCTGPSSSTATAWSAGPISAIAPSTTSRRCWRNWTGRDGISAGPCRVGPPCASPRPQAAPDSSESLVTSASPQTPHKPPIRHARLNANAPTLGTPRLPDHSPSARIEWIGFSSSPARASTILPPGTRASLELARGENRPAGDGFPRIARTQ